MHKEHGKLLAVHNQFISRTLRLVACFSLDNLGNVEWNFFLILVIVAKSDSFENISFPVMCFFSVEFCHELD